MPDSGTAGLRTIRPWCFHGDIQAPKGRMAGSPSMRLMPYTLPITSEVPLYGYTVRLFCTCVQEPVTNTGVVHPNKGLLKCGDLGSEGGG